MRTKTWSIVMIVMNSSLGLRFAQMVILGRNEEKLSHVENTRFDEFVVVLLFCQQT